MTDESNWLQEIVLSSETVFEGRVVTLRVDQVRLPSGRISRREVVAHPGAVAIIPMLPDGRVVLVRQYRQAAGQVLLEIPAGTLEPGEAPEACAHRELVEETGYRAERLLPLFASYLAPGYSSELLHVFLADGLAAATARPDLDEQIETVEVSITEAVSWVLSGQIQDAKTICGVLLAERWVKDGGR